MKQIANGILTLNNVRKMINAVLDKVYKEETNE